MLTVREVQTRLAVSEQSARNDLAGLLSMGFLSPVSLNKKSTAYTRSPEFDELLKERVDLKMERAELPSIKNIQFASISKL
jgi:predicted DNA-binding transcriptional regulator